MPENGVLAAEESLPCRVTCCTCLCTARETGALGWAMLETKTASTFPIPVCVCVCVCVCARARARIREHSTDRHLCLFIF